MRTTTRPGRRRGRWLPRPTATAAALALAATSLTAAATTWAPASQAAGADAARLCGVAFTSGGIQAGSATQDPGGVWQDSKSIIVSGWDDHLTVANPTSAGLYVLATVNLTVPDSCTVGDQAWVDMPAGMHVRGATLAPLTDASGHTIATVSTSQRPGLQQTATRLVFTLTDYVDSHKNVTASYTFQYQSGKDKGIEPDTTYTLSQTGSDSSTLNTLRWHFQGNYYPTPSGTAGWTGGATKPWGSTEIHSFTTWDGSDDVTVTAQAGTGYDWDCDSLTNTDPTNSYGIGIMTVGDRLYQVPTASHLLEPDKYTLTCDASTFTVRLPASSWTGATRDHGQLLKVLARRRPNGDMSWTDDGGVRGTVTANQTGHDTWTSTWFSPAPGSSATGHGTSLKAATPTKPTIQTDAKCGTRPTVITPKITGLDYKTTLTAEGDKATVTATARAGYYIPADATSTWTLTIPKAEPCPAVLAYDPNGGKGTMGKVTDVIGGDVDAATSTFTRKGYTFTGWATTPGGKVAYKPGQEVELTTATTTLYAVWVPDPARLAYDPNGGTGTTRPTEAVTDAKVKVAGNTFTRPGYAFTGWDTKPSGDGSDVAPGTSWTLTPGTVTLYAQWKADPASLVYDANGGTGSTPATTGRTDQKVKVAANGFTRPGYTFTGWNTKPSGDGRTVKETSSWTLAPGTTTLYATWQADPAQVVYDPAGGDGQMDPTEGVTDQKVTVAPNGFTREGYTFTGWSTTADGTGEAVAVGSAYTLTPGTTTLYATWSADPAALLYDANGATGSTPATTGRTGQKVKVAANGFDRPGYTFTGWNTAADSTGEDVDEGAEWTLTAGETTLFATWTADPAAITYDPAGGDGQMNPTEGVTDSEATVAKNQFERSGHTFAGWQVCAPTTGAPTPDGYQAAAPVAEGSQVTLPAGGLRLCATWTADPTPVASLARTGAALTAAGTLAAGLTAAGAVILARRTRRQED